MPAPSLQMKLLLIAYALRRPAILWGDSGIGKTESINALARHFDAFLQAVHGSTIEPTDIGGMPYFVEDNGKRYMVYVPPEWAHRLSGEKNGILFLDELSTTTPAGQNALLRPVRERVVGYVPLPDTVWVVCAANRPGSDIGTWTLKAALANRLFHIDWVHDYAAWEEAMLLDEWRVPELRLPENWRNHIPWAKGMILGFTRKHQPRFQSQPKNPQEATYAWPSQRSWTDLIEFLAAAHSLDENDLDLFTAVAKGYVGSTVALEFAQFLKDLDIPDPEEFLRDPASVKLPSDQPTMLVFLQNVLTAVIGKMTPERWTAAWKGYEFILDQIAEKDLPLLMLMRLKKHRPEGAALPSGESMRRLEPMMRRGGLITTRETHAAG